MAKMGRPTSYQDDYPDKVYEYVAKVQGGQMDDEVIPTVEGLAVYLEHNKSTLYDWASQDDKKAFSNALTFLSQVQAQRLQNKGLAGEYNSTITKLLLSNNHGMTDKQDITSQGDKLEGMVIYRPEKEERESD